MAKKVTKVSSAKVPKKPSAKKAPIAEVTHPLLGHSLPDMSLENQNGELVHLPTLAAAHSKLVVYFYPKDDTPGCTTEACGFRDSLNRLKKKGITVVGVSPDSSASHQKFRKKFDLNFDLLVDEGHKLADALKVWKLKKFMGREYMGIERSTFLLAAGRVMKAWQPVKVDGHVDDVITSAESL